MKSDPNQPSFSFDSLPLHWQMSRSEKYAFSKILEHANPEVAIEIGTYQGGSLQVLANIARKVFSLDINSQSQAALKPKFQNVEFLSGDSKNLLPALLSKLQEEAAPLGFVLIDGDHSTDGVKADINAVLQFKPYCPIFIVFHDSFHPNCRNGILRADWQQCPFVHYVEIDFIPGVFHFEPFDTAPARSMYGGLAVALMLPEKRNFELKIHESQRGLYETILRNSCHLEASPSFASRFKNFLKKYARYFLVSKS
jgi:hypothetical protein